MILWLSYIIHQQDKRAFGCQGLLQASLLFLHVTGLLSFHFERASSFSHHRSLQASSPHLPRACCPCAAPALLGQSETVGSKEQGGLTPIGSGVFYTLGLLLPAVNFHRSGFFHALAVFNLFIALLARSNSEQGGRGRGDGESFRNKPPLVSRMEHPTRGGPESRAWCPDTSSLGCGLWPCSNPRYSMLEAI